MGYYTVKHGDTLWDIARRNGITYWPNIYFATENNNFRQTHTNPSRIFPGDRIFIPAMSSISPMERRPKIIYRNIPLFTQSSETCWRATGEMLYIRQHPGTNAAADFSRTIGSSYLHLAAGLPVSRWHDFYVNRLGMHEATIDSQNDLHFIIASHGPAIVAIGEGASKHSMVMAGYDLFIGKWLVLDPAAGEQLTFAPMNVTVGGNPGSSSSSGQATLTNYQTGPATWQNMHRWLWILDTEIHQKVYYY